MTLKEIISANSNALQKRKLEIMGKLQSGTGNRQELRNELWLVATELRERHAFTKATA